MASMDRLIGEGQEEEKRMRKVLDGMVKKYHEGKGTINELKKYVA